MKTKVIAKFRVVDNLFILLYVNKRVCTKVVYSNIDEIKEDFPETIYKLKFI